MRKRVSLAAKRPVAAVLGVLGHLCAAHVLLAQDSVTIDVQECLKLKTPDERLDCYERRADEASKHTAAAPAAPAPAAAPVAGAPAPPAAVAAAPAAAAPAAAVSAPPPAASVAPSPAAAQPPPSSFAGQTTKQSPEPPEVIATITAVRETVPSSYLITLDNGQVWSQSYPEQYGLRPGQRVTLRASKWGTSYHLSVEGQNGFIQVKRVK